MHCSLIVVRITATCYA